ncbi:MAG: phage terminase large subunit [Dehalococcoidia bacterium]|nr:phage terminase large subunit [Dehalococcoidia bacterium]
MHEIQLFAKQGAFVADPTRHVCVVTGVGGGKTRGGAVKLLRYIAEHPGSWGVVTAPTFPMLRDATLQTIREVWPPELLRGFHPGEMRLDVPNGSVVLFRSTDEPDRLRGPNLAFVWMDEAAQSKHEAFRVLQGRIRQHGYPGQMWLTTTPRGFDWIWEEFAKEEGREGYALHHWSARDNPYLPPEYIKTLEESYPEELALQEIEGLFTIVSGTPYFSIAALRTAREDCLVPVEERLGGLVKVWKKPVVNGLYVTGCDTAWGKTGSYSCAVVYEWRTGEQVAEVHGRPPLDELAREVVTLCAEYNRAYLVPEWAGDEDEGQYAVRLMEELGYRDRMYYRDDKREKPGWVTSGTSRSYMLAQLEHAVRSRGVIIRCKDAMAEFMAFTRQEDGRPAAAPNMHDDHVMAWALALQGADHAQFFIPRTAPVVIHAPQHRGDAHLTAPVRRL